MKTTIKTSAPNTLESVMIKPRSNILPFGAGYLNFLTKAAAMDEEEPASRSLRHQPVRYLAAVESAMEVPGHGRAAAKVSAMPSLHEAVVALRNKIRVS